MNQVDFRLRNGAKYLRDNGRLNLLVVLMCHSNVRNRCWPSMDLLVEETGWSLPEVTLAKKWLIEHGAIELVPFTERVGEELLLPVRQHVYQLTGKFTVDDFEYPYFYLPPVDKVIAKREVSSGEVSSGEVSLDETKVLQVLEVVPDSKIKDFVSISSDEHVSSQQPKIAMPAYMSSKIKITEEEQTQSVELESEPIKIHPLEQAILYLCKSTGTTKLEDSHCKKLHADVRFKYQDKWVQYSPIRAWDELPRFQEWIEDVLFTQLINHIPENNGVRKISRTKVVDSIRNQMHAYAAWVETAKPLKTVKVSKRFDPNCEQCGGKGYYFDDDWQRINCNCGGSNA